MYINQIKKPNGIGDPCSKYGLGKGGEKFEADLKAAEDRYNWLWAEFIEFMKSRNVDPRELRGMFVRYYEEFID